MDVTWRVRVGEDDTSAAYQGAEGSFARVVLVLGHGASSHRDHPTMTSLAATFVGCGLPVVRFNFLYTEKKHGPPDRMPRLMETFAAVVERVRLEQRPERVIIGGHSMGGRAASMMAADGFTCDGLLLLAYPLHPAGQPEKLRDAHLAAITVPTLCMNGTRDDLCQRDLMQAVLSRLPRSFQMHWLEGADHSFHVQKRSGRTEADVQAEIGQAARTWMVESVMGGSRRANDG